MICSISAKISGLYCHILEIWILQYLAAFTRSQNLSYRKLSKHIILIDKLSQITHARVICSDLNDIINSSFYIALVMVPIVQTHCHRLIVTRCSSSVRTYTLYNVQGLVQCACIVLDIAAARHNCTRQHWCTISCHLPVWHLWHLKVSHFRRVSNSFIAIFVIQPYKPICLYGKCIWFEIILLLYA